MAPITAGKSSPCSGRSGRKRLRLTCCTSFEKAGRRRREHGDKRPATHLVTQHTHSHCGESSQMTTRFLPLGTCPAASSKKKTTFPPRWPSTETASLRRSGG